MLKYETPPKRPSVNSRFHEDASGLGGVMHSIEKQLTGSRYVNTAGTTLPANQVTNTTQGVFNKGTDSSKKDSG